MIKKRLLCGALVSATMASYAAPAETWSLKATYSYVKADGSVVANQPAMLFKLAPGECKKGVTRVTQMVHADMAMTQKACVKQDSETGFISASGWLMAPKIITDVQQIDGTRGNALSLDYGQQFDIETNGTLVHSRVGPYNVEFKRISAENIKVPKKVVEENKVVRSKKGKQEN